MKPDEIVLLGVNHSAVRRSPLSPAALPLVFALAFLPAILHLLSVDLPVTDPLAALGPAAAGIWLAAGLRDLRFHFALVGATFVTLLWAVNWLMLAEFGCCSQTG